MPQDEPLTMDEIRQMQRRRKRGGARPAPSEQSPTEAPSQGAAEIARLIGQPEQIVQRIKEKGAPETVEEYMRKADLPPEMVAITNVVRDFAEWMEQKSAGGSPPNREQVGRKVQSLARQHDVSPQRAQRAVGAMLKRYNLALKRGMMKEDMRGRPHRRTDQRAQLDREQEGAE